MPGLFKSSSTAGGGSKGRQSIRGRISGPIPIHSTTIDDDEFPIRHPGTGIATPMGNEGREKQLQPPPERSSTIVVPGNTPPDSSRNKTDSVAPSGPSPASGVSGSPPQRRTKPASSTLRYSTASAGSGTGTQQSKDTPQRKKSTLRFALSKLFGRKKKSDSEGSTLSEANVSGTGSPAHHRSDPSALSRSPKEAEPKRSASLPITEYDRALRSHSIGPEDIVAIESARNSVVEPGFHRRRATTLATSRLYSGSGVRDFGGFGGLSPRPASTHGRGSNLIVDEDDHEEIGMAITSDTVGHRRRSRSLSQLHDLAEGQPQARRRSDEIRYWRESYDPGFMSPTSSNVNEDTGNVEVEMSELPVLEQPPQTPPQPFNFGNMDTMKDVLGMKITSQVGLEDRVAILEARNQKLEQMVSQLYQGLPNVRPFPETPERAPPQVPASERSATYVPSSAAVNPSIYQAISSELHGSSRYTASRDSNDSHLSFGEAPTFVGSIPPSNRPANRPTSTATVRGTTSLPTLPREITGPFTADHYTTLLALVETERSARQALEAQVTKLSHKVDLLSRMSGKLEIVPTGPPTGTYSTFEHDDDDETNSAVPGDDDYSGSEAFKTPREEKPLHGFGAFGEELREDDDPARKKAARTLSLSQLTLGKPKKKQPDVGVNL